MSNAVQVGVVGLGARYARRYRPALLRCRERFVVRAVCDQVQQRALTEAKHWNCAASAGVLDVLEQPDVEAILLLDRQWHRLWPLQMACSFGKPVFCCDPLACDDAHADEILQDIEQSKLPVMLAMTPRLAPATDQLRELFNTQLGAPRFLVCEHARPRQLRQGPGPAAELNLLGPSATALLDWCAWLLDGEPQSVLAGTLGADWLHFLTLACDDRRGIHITCRRGPGLRAGVRLHAVADHGSAVVDLPHRVSWSDGKGEHTLCLRARLSMTDQLLETFWHMVRTGARPEPGVREAYRVLGWLRAGKRSLREQRQIAL
ncbi:MAG TPA: Gfo/Idh/MocA family oxidoreductase [Gemmataceae bacterium]|nr:Gfo/Idh/MocA family oxidoreductase [Gemmataceae bacterium]